MTTEARKKPAPPDQADRDRIGTSTDETLFVSAGAGSGKTTALVDRVAELVLSDGVPMEKIAAVTFTIKAGAELRDRLRARFEKALREATDGDEESLAQRALNDLDMAAIGTLHAFAQRILTAHPIEARLPPAVEVLDEVGSSIAFEERWSRIQQQLLDDDGISEALILGMSAGITLKHIRQLVKLLGQDWDRIESHVLSSPLPPLAMPDMAPVDSAILALEEMALGCSDPSDMFCGKLHEALGCLRAVRDAESTTEALALMGALEEAKKLGGGGKAGNWGGQNVKDLKAAVREALDGALAVRGEIVGLCLRHLAAWVARRVLDEAEGRRASGKLEFHDLLVLARDLLADAAEVRATLHDTYHRLLLDEFQDTDPIQIELAMRIAGGRDAGQSNWQDIDVPAGRLFVVGDAKQSIYRFRRASIATYLAAERVFGEDARASLTTNFRSLPALVEWVNGVFGELIEYVEDGQPDYEPLASYRTDEDKLVGPAVTVLGTEPHEGLDAAGLRVQEAADVAAAIAEILDHGWTVFDESRKAWRTAEPADIAVLLPSRASMPMLEDALDAAGIDFRAEAMTLVYEHQEIRDLLMTARAVADPSDELALVATLRTPLFACGDDDLWRWRQGEGRFRLFARRPNEELADGPVGRALDYMEHLHRRARWLTPSEVLSTIVDDRRMLELSAYDARYRDAWRRVRFVVDQARAWTEISHGGLRAYLTWVAHQAQEKARVSEAVLPEQDVDAVRVMTVHAAKGLEFPIVVLSGMTAEARQQSGVRVLWQDDGYAVSLKKDLKDPTFDDEATIDEQMSDLEKVRLLYVAATRARDHLVVSLHRHVKPKNTPAELIVRGGGDDVGAPHHFQRPTGFVRRRPAREVATPPPAYDAWLARIQAAQAASRRKRVLTASGLEGTEPEVVLAEAGELDAAAREGAAGKAKGPRDLELPPWSKGRYGSAVGRAVHGVLQVIDLPTGEGLEAAVAAQVVAEGLSGLESVVTDLVRSARASEVVQRAAVREHWREAYVGAPRASDGELVEGIIDLLYREDDGSLVVVDYKTDIITASTIETKVAFYRPQLDAYREALTTTTGLPVSARLLFLHPGGSRTVDVA